MAIHRQVKPYVGSSHVESSTHEAVGAAVVGDAIGAKVVGDALGVALGAALGAALGIPGAYRWHVSLSRHCVVGHPGPPSGTPPSTTMLDVLVVPPVHDAQVRWCTSCHELEEYSIVPTHASVAGFRTCTAQMSV